MFRGATQINCQFSAQSPFQCQRNAALHRTFVKFHQFLMTICAAPLRDSAVFAFGTSNTHLLTAASCIREPVHLYSVALFEHRACGSSFSVISTLTSLHSKRRWRKRRGARRSLFSLP